MAPKKASTPPIRRSDRSRRTIDRFAPMLSMGSSSHRLFLAAPPALIRTHSAPIPEIITSPVAMTAHAATDASSVSTTPNAIAESELGSPNDRDFENLNIEPNFAELEGTPSEIDASEQELQTSSPLDGLFLGYVDSNRDSASVDDLSDDATSVLAFSDASFSVSSISLASNVSDFSIHGDLPYSGDLLEALSLQGQALTLLEQHTETEGNLPPSPVPHVSPFLQ